MKQQLSDSAAVVLVLILVGLAGSLLRPAPAPAAERAMEQPPIVLIVTATPMIELPATADIPVPTAVPLAVEAPTSVPPVAVEPVRVEYVQVIESQPAPATPDLPPPAPTTGSKPNRREAPPPRYAANPIHDAPEAVQP